MMRRKPVFLTFCAWLATIAVAVVLTACGGGDDTVALTPGEPQVLSATELSAFASEQSEPVYWLGARKGSELEVTHSSDGRIYIRYLTDGAEVGDPRAKFLTVGTYPGKSGVAALRAALASHSGSKLVRTDDGALLLIDAASPQNAHLAYPGQGVQIEVFSPVPGAALRLASAGDVQPVP
jgi:hypothetical protein